jgi:O-antigen/teichoic acid export membrane protein
MLHKVTKNTALLMLGQVGALGLNAVSIIILARHWDESLFGIFSYGLVYVGFIGLISDFGMKPVLVREMTRNRYKADSVVNSASVVKLCLCGIAICLGCAVARIFFDAFQFKTVAALILVTLFSSKSGTVRVVFESLFQADMDMQYPVGFQLTDSLLQVLAVWLLIHLNASFMVILLGYVFSNIPGFLWTIAATRRRIKLRMKADLAIVRWLLKESFPLFLYLILAMLYERMDVLFLKSFHGESMVGVYSSAFRLTAPLVFIPYAVVTALYPLMTKADDKQGHALSRLFGFGLKLLLMIGITVNVAGLVVGKPVFLLFFGVRFAEAVFPFQLLLLSQSIMFLIFFMVDYINARGRQKKNTLYIAIMVLASLFLQRSFIKAFGVIGAGWAKIILNTMSLSVLFLLVRGDLSREQRGHFYKTGLMLLSFLVPACGSFALNVPSWVTGLVLGAITITGVFWLFSPDEKRLMNTLFRDVMVKWGLAEGIPAP